MNVKSGYLIFKKYKTFSVLIYSYINTSENWKHEKLCGNTSVFTQFQVFPIDLFNNSDAILNRDALWSIQGKNHHVNAAIVRGIRRTGKILR